MSEDDDYDNEDSGPSKARIALAGAAVPAIVLAAIVFLWPALSGGDDSVSDDASTTASAPASSEEVNSIETTADEATSSAPAATDDVSTETEAPPATEAAPDTEAPPATEAAPDTDAPPATEAAPDTDAPPATDAPAGTTPPSTAAKAPATTNPTPENVTYVTMPDGSAAPVVVVFGNEEIVLSGAVPTEATGQRLVGLAEAFKKPDQGPVRSILTINPDVPIGVGVRVVERTSSRFPAGSAEVTPPHALELDRAVSVMSAFPHVTVLVIGHSDQRGDALGNYELSAQRAESVVNYMAANGVSPDRLASRAVGEADLLSLNDDQISLELNRRTEFVFNGLLIEAEAE